MFAAASPLPTILLLTSIGLGLTPVTGMQRVM
jgi:hypothetical protein